MVRGTRVDRAWVAKAVRCIEAEASRSADTHLLKFPLPPEWGIDLYLKDESVHPTGSLKHRLARSLFLYALVNGWVTSETTVLEASSGSTAISEAYFARLLGLPFVAVMPSSTSLEKVRLIEAYGGRCALVEDGSTIYERARSLAQEVRGHYMDQFLNAERATDWRGNNNIAESMHEQLCLERHPIPTWIVVGAGTGGTSATIGRYVRYRRLSTRLCVVDPENSAFYPAWTTKDWTVTTRGSRIEGIGRPRVEPSFLPGVVDRMICVPDAASVAMTRLIRERTGWTVGGSTGTNLWGALLLVAELRSQGREGSVVTLICDGGDRYRDTLWSEDWVHRQGLNPRAPLEQAATFLDTGEWLDDR